MPTEFNVEWYVILFSKEVQLKKVRKLSRYEMLFV